MTRRIEVHICSHYMPTRIPAMSAVLKAMASWRDCTVEAVIDTNCDDYARHDFLPAFQACFAQAGHALRLNPVSDLPHPYELTWSHKRFIPPWLQAASAEDLFIYIEDDIVLTDQNIRYYLETLNALEGTDLIPGFLRYEMKDGEMRSVDLDRPEYWERDRSLSVNGATYHACNNPYWAGFILDRRLASEYVASRSFTIEGSTFHPWDVRARAAMGLTFERPHQRLRSRVVVPIVDGSPDPACLVWHSANNYTASDHPVFGRLTIQKAFQREGAAHYLVRKLRGVPGRIDRLIHGDSRFRKINQYGSPYGGEGSSPK